MIEFVVLVFTALSVAVILRVGLTKPITKTRSDLCEICGNGKASEGRFSVIIPSSGDKEIQQILLCALCAMDDEQYEKVGRESE